MMISRRNALMSALFGAGYVGLRSLATGIPAAVLLGGRRALAAAASCANPAKAQYMILSTSGNGDPINANVPGTYDFVDIAHSQDPAMKPLPLTIGGRTTMAATPWTTLPASVLARTCFWHLATTTQVHPKEPDVLKLMGNTVAGEMLPSLLAKQLAPCLNTAQTQPITVGASSPSEGLSFGGAALPIIPPVALSSTLTNPAGPLTSLQGLRDQTLNQLGDLFRGTASPAQKAYLDSVVSSQTQIRNISQGLLTSLSSIADNSVASQITAAIALIQMNITPVVAIHIPFGGDNHTDPTLAREAQETVAGVTAIGSLIAQLEAAQLADRVTFMSLNVFGRTLISSKVDGRNHNENHQVSITIGKPFKGGVIGGIGPVGRDYGALAINSTTGAGGTGGDVGPAESLSSFGRTMLAAVGVDSATIGSVITNGKLIPAALA